MNPPSNNIQEVRVMTALNRKLLTHVPAVCATLLLGVQTASATDQPAGVSTDTHLAPVTLNLKVYKLDTTAWRKLGSSGSDSRFDSIVRKHGSLLHDDTFTTLEAHSNPWENTVSRTLGAWCEGSEFTGEPSVVTTGDSFKIEVPTMTKLQEAAVHVTGQHAALNAIHNTTVDGCTLQQPDTSTMTIDKLVTLKPGESQLLFTGLGDASDGHPADRLAYVLSMPAK
jgi:hypothetical protein